MARMRSKLFGKAEAGGLLELRSVIMGREFVSFIEDNEIPSGSTEFLLKLFIARELVETDD